MMKTLRYFFVAALAIVGMNVSAQTVTFDANVDKGTRTSSEPGEDQITKDGVTIAVSNGCMNLTDQYRCYKNATFTVTSTVGNIQKVEITCTVAGAEKYGPGCFTDATAGTYAYEEKVGTWTGDAASFSLTASSNQVRITTCVVTLAGGGGGETVWDFTVLPTQTIDGTGNMEANVTVFTEDEGAGWQQAYNKADFPDGTEFMATATDVFTPFKGLKWSAMANNKMVFYRNYPDKDGSRYGGKHLAFNKEAEFMLPAKAGQKIEMVVASSKSGGTTKKIKSPDVVEIFDETEHGLKIEFTTAYEYQTVTLTAAVDNPYLTFESTFCVQKITVKDGGASGIAAVKAANKVANGEMFNLSGQKVGKDYKGIVIMNGKKMINK